MNIYEGPEKYIYACYSQKDYDRVLPILKALIKEGFRIWYDSGIEVGSEWPDLIAKRLENSDRVIVFISENLVASRSCRNEINYACTLNKEFFAIYLEPTQLSFGLNLHFSSVQSLYLDKYPNTASFLNDLTNSAFLLPCKEGNEIKSDPKKDTVKTEIRNPEPPIKNITVDKIKKDAEAPKTETKRTVPPPKSKIKNTPLSQESEALLSDKNTDIKKKNYQIFISYRRKGGDVVAKLICSELKNRGYSVFYDYDSLKGGYFDRNIIDAIEGCEYFILVLPKRALARCRHKDDWVRQEIVCALQQNKKIIPVMLEKFKFPRKLPPDIADVSRYNGVRFDMAYLDAVIDKIIEKFST